MEDLGFEDVLARGIKKMNELRDKPEQYNVGIDTIERARQNMTQEELIGAYKFNIDKYIWRKKGSDKEDLIKAKDYLELWIEILDNNGTV